MTAWLYEAQQSEQCVSAGHWSRSFQATFCNSSECSNRFKMKTRHDLEISRQLKIKKNRTTKFAEIDDLSDIRTIEIDIANEIFVGRPFRIVTIVTVQSLPKISRETRRVLGRQCQLSGRTIRESRSVSGRELKLHFNKILASWNVLN